MSTKKNPSKAKIRSATNDDVAPVALKERPLPELDDPTPILPLEEKEEVAILDADGTEETEEADDGIAEDEIDPFGDKWEQ